ncbi:hypothetical protein ASD28_29115 [Massilia sp. Root133]|uniref:hypothetical protein n=1 Tax=unclassified Massilia TaxID=2609279 RepID=UPI0006F2C47C|nr:MULTISPECIES: hypothetical protein [unclassified Massilia]KQY08839.1 hypothetical protein ASD28_29115 [Massilia sp. Root133]KQZ40144.1 hypothetical protein ASD92_02525 [Massilia sp. Root1485]
MTTARLPRLLACALALAACTAHAATPRLWKATHAVEGHGTTTLYVLAATPAGLPAEFDAYYTRAVLPALRASATLAVEGVGDGEEGPATPGCDLHQLDEQGIAMLNDARQRILTLTLQADMARRDALDVKALAKAPDPDTQAQAWARLIEMSDEFTLLQFARVQAASLASAAPDHKQGANVAEALVRARPDIPVHDIDYRTGMMHAYCAAGPRRTMMLLDVVDSAPPSATATARLTRDFDALLRGRAPSDGSPLTRLAPLDAGLVCARNRDWIARMGKVADGRAHFYVVPVRNLFAARHDDADCGGLLDELEQAGFTVAAVK